jgi:hypothetical protein
VRESFAYAYRAIGGRKALAEWARANPADFYALLVRLAPRQIEIEGELALPIVRVKDLTGQRATPAAIAADVISQVRVVAEG